MCTLAGRGRFKLSSSSCGARFKMVLAFTCIQQTTIQTRAAPKCLRQAQLGVSEESAPGLRANTWVKPEHGMGSAQKRGRLIARRNVRSGATRPRRRRTSSPARRTLRRHAGREPMSRTETGQFCSGAVRDALIPHRGGRLIAARPLRKRIPIQVRRTLRRRAAHVPAVRRPRWGSPPRPAAPCRSRQTSLPAQPRR